MPKTIDENGNPIQEVAVVTKSDTTYFDTYFDISIALPFIVGNVFDYSLMQEEPPQPKIYDTPKLIESVKFNTFGKNAKHKKKHKHKHNGKYGKGK